MAFVLDSYVLSYSLLIAFLSRRAHTMGQKVDHVNNVLLYLISLDPDINHFLYPA